MAVVLAAFSRYVRDRRPRWASRARLAAVAAGVPGLVLLLAGVLKPDRRLVGWAGDQPDRRHRQLGRSGAVVYQAPCPLPRRGRSGGGTDAGTTQIRPPNLRSGHLNQHTDADIYRWISNGLTGGMPAWAGSLSETDRWNLVNYLRSINGHPRAARRRPGGRTHRGRSHFASPSAAASTTTRAEPPEAAGLVIAGGLGSVLLGWMAFGFGRMGRSHRRQSRGRVPDDR